MRIFRESGLIIEQYAKGRYDFGSWVSIITEYSVSSTLNYF